MKNQDCKKFLSVISKVDKINIVFYYKPREKFYDEYFYIQKKDIQSIFALSTIPINNSSIL